jgi:hypothetical protein
MSYPAIYRARAAANGSGLDVFVPQVFGDTPIKVTDSVGGQVPGMGWVMFQGGDAAHPVWLADIGLGSGGGSIEGLDEVWIGPDQPDDSYELWYDTDATAPAPVWAPVVLPALVSGAFSNPPNVRIDGGVVEMIGTVALAAGFAAYSVGTIPVGYRPSLMTVQGQVEYRNSGSPVIVPVIVSVTAAGAVNVDGYFAPGWFSLNMRWRL